MQNHSHPQHRRPGPACASFADALPLLGLNALGTEEAARLRTHLATCIYCQTQRAAYDRIDVALQRTFSTGATFLLSPEELVAMTNDEQWPEVPAATYDRAEPGAPGESAGYTRSEANSASLHSRETLQSRETMNKTNDRRQASVPGANSPASTRRGLVSLHTPLAVIAAVLVVGLLAATFVVFSHHPSSSVDATTTPTPAPTMSPPPVGSWSPVTSLTTSSSFANALPAIAPSDPRIVYEVTKNPQPALRRTADGGATWQPLPLPVQNAAYWMQLYVSPLNPNVVVLHTDGYVSQPSTCNSRADAWIPTAKATAATSPLADLAPAVPSSGIAACTQFLSTDGGKTWTQTSEYFDNARIIQDQAGGYGLFMVQGNRLYTYADFTCQEPGDATTYMCAGGLLVSMDGGMSWKPASIPSPQTFCGLALAPTGIVMFAITSTECDAGSGTPENTIWRSDDAGAHWMPVSHLQFASSDSSLVVPSAGAAYPTVYLKTSTVTLTPAPNPPTSTETPTPTPNSPASIATPTTTLNPQPIPTTTTTLQMSQDGGKTWSVVPTTGIPAGWLDSELIGQTSDGSVVAIFGSGNGGGAALYSWRPGAARWQLVAPEPPQDPATYPVTTYLVTPSPVGQGDTLWAVSVLQKQQGNSILFTNTVYRLQLSA